MKSTEVQIEQPMKDWLQEVGGTYLDSFVILPEGANELLTKDVAKVIEEETNKLVLDLVERYLDWLDAPKKEHCFPEGADGSGEVLEVFDEDREEFILNDPVDTLGDFLRAFNGQWLATYQRGYGKQHLTNGNDVFDDSHSCVKTIYEKMYPDGLPSVVDDLLMESAAELASALYDISLTDLPSECHQSRLATKKD